LKLRKAIGPVYPGNTHIPLASLHPAIAARTITITSATKSFNIPALRCAVMHFGSPELKGRFGRRIPSRLLGSPGVTGVDATVAAWDDGQNWLSRAPPQRPVVYDAGHAIRPERLPK
jgi:cystathionine beta-lyase